ncbi:PqqD family protein [Acidicapsa dinghuensis]|uniref:PqqD family protein n=1 Tax=Acidicapsa dinghuensis TaxID=2218256 RepID=A0ABW1ECU8_9BACT|nr:PqqD family protein [Acidicapsa dinghuensis]
MEFPTPQLRSVVDQDGGVILDINSDQFFSLNPIGALIWTQLANGKTLEQIKDAIAGQTGMDRAVISTDVDEFVADLKAKRLFHFCV